MCYDVTYPNDGAKDRLLLNDSFSDDDPGMIYRGHLKIEKNTVVVIMPDDDNPNPNTTVISLYI